MRATAAAEHTDNPSTTGASLTSKATAGAADTASPRYTSLTEALGLTAPPAETNAAAQPKKPVISIADLTRND